MTTEEIIEYRLAEVAGEREYPYSFIRCIGLGTDPVTYARYLMGKGINKPIDLVRLVRNDCITTLPQAKMAVEKALGRRL